LDELARFCAILRNFRKKFDVSSCQQRAKFFSKKFFWLDTPCTILLHYLAIFKNPEKQVI
jgi:hypothetical protein